MFMLIYRNATGQGCQIYFSKKIKPSVRKGQKRPTELLKKAKHSI